jgi:hypothetical protein
VYQRPTHLQTGEDFSGHGAIKGVELLGSVELDAAEAVDRVEQDIVRLVAGEFLGNFGGG